MENEAKEPRISLTEGIIVLLFMLVIMGFSVIKLQISPQIPILFVILLLIGWAKVRKFSWDSVNQELLTGFQPVLFRCLFLF